MRCIFLALAAVAFTALRGQDMAYTRKTLDALTGKKLFGRGYVHNGLHRAARYLEKEMRHAHGQALFGRQYTQAFHFPVNTFPVATATLNGVPLHAGTDFIPHPASRGFQGSVRLTQRDSTHYFAVSGDNRLEVALKRKLTFSVATEVKTYAEIEVDQNLHPGPLSEISLDLRNHLGDQVSENLGCYIPGTRTDSMVVFTAHYDHLGGVGDAYFPGANDNASGVSMLLNLLRHYAAHPAPYRTVFILFAGEEAGLLGSKHFVDHPAIALEKIRFLLNLDLLGTGDEGIMVVNATVRPAEFSWLEEINNAEHLLPDVKRRGKAANSDHYWFSEKGVPAFFIYTLGGSKAYHDVNDRPAALSLAGYKGVFTLITRFVSVL